MTRFAWATNVMRWFVSKHSISFSHNVYELKLIDKLTNGLSVSDILDRSEKSLFLSIHIAVWITFDLMRFYLTNAYTHCVCVYKKSVIALMFKYKFDLEIVWHLRSSHSHKYFTFTTGDDGSKPWHGSRCYPCSLNCQNSRKPRHYWHWCTRVQCNA